MKAADLFARTDARYKRWDQTAARNADIRRRVRYEREPVAQAAKEYGLAPEKVERIAGLFGV